MFCFKCGKEIPDSSIYCQYCGTNLKSPSRVDVIFDYLNRFVKHNKILSILLGIWIIFHLCIFLISSPKRYKGNGSFVDNSAGFFPFNAENILAFDINVYDFSEFIFYAVLIPFLIILILKQFNASGWLKKHKTVCSIYGIWFIINLSLYLLSPQNIHCESFFYPFGSYNYFFDIGDYDGLEFIIYTLLFPLFVLCIITVFRTLLPNGRKKTEKSISANKENVKKDNDGHTELKARLKDQDGLECGATIVHEPSKEKTNSSSLIQLLVGDIIICCITSFVCSIIWGIWLFSSFGSTSTINSLNFQTGSIYVLLVVLLVDMLGLSIALSRYRKRNLSLYFYFYPFVFLEILIITVCLWMNDNNVFGFLDYLTKAMIYLSITNVITLIAFLVIPKSASSS